MDGSQGDDAPDGSGGPGFDALLGALGGAIRAGSWPPGWTGPGWSSAWTAAARDVSPDLADHLLAATAQLLGAVRGFVEVAERVVDEQRTRLRDDHPEAEPPSDAADAAADAADVADADGPGDAGAAGRDATPGRDGAASPRSRRVRRIALDDDT